MDKNDFWKLIDDARLAAGSEPEGQIEALTAQLADLPPDEIVAFDRILSEYHTRAYDWSLWGAAYVIGGGCSDDGFMDFRGWLISRGEKDYEAALANPESLVEVVTDSDGDCQIEGFQYIASQVWEQKTGKSGDDFPSHDIEYREDPSGTPWEEEELEQRFPMLCDKFL